MAETSQQFLDAALGLAWADWEEHRRICCLSQEQFAKHLLSFHQQSCTTFVKSVTTFNNISSMQTSDVDAAVVNSDAVSVDPTSMTYKSELSPPGLPSDSSVIHLNAQPAPPGDSSVPPHAAGTMSGNMGAAGLEMSLPAQSTMTAPLMDTTMTQLNCDTNMTSQTDSGELMTPVLTLKDVAQMSQIGGADASHQTSEMNDAQTVGPCVGSATHGEIDTALTTQGVMEAALASAGLGSTGLGSTNLPADAEDDEDTEPLIDEVMNVPLGTEWVCDPLNCVCSIEHGQQTVSQGSQCRTSRLNEDANKCVQVSVRVPLEKPCKSKKRGRPKQSEKYPPLKMRINRQDVPLMDFSSDEDYDDEDYVPTSLPYTCGVCQQSFAIEEQIDTHICLNTNDIDQKPLLCLRCNQAFTTANALTKHARTCNGVDVKDRRNLRNVKTYSCDLCGLSLSALFELKSHHLEQHGGENFPFECETCGKAFLVKSKLEIHNLKHLSFDFTSPVSMDEITAGVNEALEQTKALMPPPMMHPSGITPLKQAKGNYNCPVCNAVFVMEHRLNTHLATLHRPCSECVNLSRCRCGVSPGKFTCEVCGQQYTKEVTLKKHMAFHTGEKLPHECNICGKGFIQLGKYREHYRIHTGERPCVCSYCGKTFRKSEHLRRHTMIHTRLHKCSVCEEVFVDQADLKEHFLIHKKERRFKCEVCDAGFTTSEHLRRHGFVHSKERPFNCHLCTKSFAQQSGLKDHLTTHSNERNFVCAVCGTRFKRARYLIIHMRLHNGTAKPKKKSEVPFPCTTCGKVFTRKDGLQRHMQTHTGIHPHQCEHCGKGFSRRYKLNKHIESQHTPGVEPKDLTRKPAQRSKVAPLNLNQSADGTLTLNTQSTIIKSPMSTPNPVPLSRPESVNSVVNMGDVGGAPGVVTPHQQIAYPREYATDAERFVRNMMQGMNAANIDPNVYYQQHHHRPPQQQILIQQQQHIDAPAPSPATPGVVTSATPHAHGSSTPSHSNPSPYPMLAAHSAITNGTAGFIQAAPPAHNNAAPGPPTHPGGHTTGHHPQTTIMSPTELTAAGTAIRPPAFPHNPPHGGAEQVLPYLHWSTAGIPPTALPHTDGMNAAAVHLPIGQKYAAAPRPVMNIYSPPHRESI